MINLIDDRNYNDSHFFRQLVRADGSSYSVSNPDLLPDDLYNSIQYNNTAVFEAILSSKPFKLDTVRFANSLTPLHVAVIHGSEDILALLLNVYDVSITVVDVANRSPLDWAILCGHRNIVQILESHSETMRSKACAGEDRALHLLAILTD